eukprot:1182859-Prorocentrum_minimum.AAC.2
MELYSTQTHTIVRSLHRRVACPSSCQCARESNKRTQRAASGRPSDDLFRVGVSPTPPRRRSRGTGSWAASRGTPPCTAPSAAAAGWPRGGPPPSRPPASHTKQ